ncbi:MAG: hypothetical protein ACREB9_00635 [Thermoplasmata archaeon]
MDALPRRGPPPVEPAHVELVHDPEMGALLYRIVEPELDAAELALLAEARDRLFDSDMPPPHDPETPRVAWVTGSRRLRGTIPASPTRLDGNGSMDGCAAICSGSARSTSP